MVKKDIISALLMFLDEGLYDSESINYSDIESAINESQYKIINNLVRGADERGLRTTYQISSVANADNPNYGDNAKDIVSYDGYKLLYPRGCWIDYTGNGDYETATYIEPTQIQQFNNYTFSGARTLGAYYTVVHRHISGVEATNAYFTDPNDENLATVFYVANPMKWIASGASGYPSGYVTNELILPSEYHHQVVLMAAEILNNRDVMEYERGSIAVREAGMINTFGKMSND